MIIAMFGYLDGYNGTGVGKPGTKFGDLSYIGMRMVRLLFWMFRMKHRVLNQTNHLYIYTVDLQCDGLLDRAHLLSDSLGDDFFAASLHVRLAAHDLRYINKNNYYNHIGSFGISELFIIFCNV